MAAGILFLRNRIISQLTERKLEKRTLTSGLRLKNILLIILLTLPLAVLVLDFENVYGHGIGTETFPPINLNGRQVTLEVSSSKNDSETRDDQQISISLIDFDSKITLRDVTFLIKSERGDQFLFEQEFKADSGFIVFNFVSKETGSQVIVEEDDNAGGLFSSLLGLESRMVHVKGPKLSEGGLYKFDVSVLTADGYSQKINDPPVFNAGISIAQTSTHDFVDPNFGQQSIDVITYYDEISNFQYNSDSKEISFFMPFDWTLSNINQTSVVHQELVIPKAFGDLLTSGFVMHVNGVRLSEDIVNIDDFFTDDRVVHFIIYQKELQNILNNSSGQDGMNFLIKPSFTYPHLSSVTENGQFKILVSWEPENLKSGSNAKILFDVTDIFLKNRSVATNYDFSITQGDRIIFEQSGISSDAKDKHNIVEFFVPNDISGIISLNFKNLDGNDLAKSTVPIVVDRTITTTDATGDALSLPEWIKNNALRWSQNQINDAAFIEGIKYLIQNNIISVPQTQQQSLGSQEIPSWFKINAEWWATGLISDKAFVNSLQYLVNRDIIPV